MTELWKDLRTIYNLVRPIRSSEHAEKMEEFYKNQAGDYDSFRKRLLPGRKALFEHIDHLKPGPVWLDFGAGTGSNLELINLDKFKHIELVDLSSSLLKEARQRAERLRASQVLFRHEDVTVFNSSEPVDLITFSYSLTMIPDWFLAIDNAYRLLKPGGLIAVVDFHIPTLSMSEDGPLQSFFTQHFWPKWFAWDSVYLNRDHMRYLKSRFQQEWCLQDVHRLPYLPLSKVPYYFFIGRKITK